MVYHYDSDDYPPAERPSVEQVRRVIAPGPRPNAMGPENTFELSQGFVRSITESNPDFRLNSFRSSMNSLAAVLAANVSDELAGEKIDLREFETSAKFAKYRSAAVPA